MVDGPVRGVGGEGRSGGAHAAEGAPALEEREGAALRDVVQVAAQDHRARRPRALPALDEQRLQQRPRLGHTALVVRQPVQVSVGHAQGRAFHVEGDHHGRSWLQGAGGERDHLGGHHLRSREDREAIAAPLKVHEGREVGRHSQARTEGRRLVHAPRPGRPLVHLLEQHHVRARGRQVVAHTLEVEDPVHAEAVFDVVGHKAQGGRRRRSVRGSGAGHEEGEGEEESHGLILP